MNLPTRGELDLNYLVAEYVTNPEGMQLLHPAVTKVGAGEGIDFGTVTV